MMRPANFILALCITLIAVLPCAVLSNKITALERRVGILTKQLETAQTDIEAAMAAIERQDSRVEGYSAKVDNMIFNYKDLDEILKHLFGYEQKQYMDNH